MRICFIADSSSIHVQRIVAHSVRKKDDVLVLSSAPHMVDIPGTRTVHLLNTNTPSFAISFEDRERKNNFTTYLKSFVPISSKLLIIETMKSLHLLGKREVCVEEIERFNPEVIYCFRSFPEGILTPYCHIRPLLLRTAGPDISKFTKYPVYRRVIRRALQTADVVVTESLWEKKLLRQMCNGQTDPKIIIVGVDTTLFQPPTSRSNLRNKYNLPLDAFVVVSNRPLTGHYNGWLVVKAIQSILEQCPNLFLVYGNPSKMDLRTKDKAEAIASRFPRIKFIDRAVPHSEVPDILGCGDVYVSFSSYDGVPNSVLEAMACGLVPIVGELPQLHDWIEQGVAGYFIPQYDTKCLASMINELYKNRQALSDMSARCVSKIREQGSDEECMERTRDLLKYLVHADSRATIYK